ncbi:MAG: hypothetical protein IMF15_06345 [Proteobacteria bacterium]|nr:hypothetical protein [Pseudomonadota bacterium]
MTNPYKPIACSLHDEYEIAIMHKKHLSIKWTDDDGQYTENVLPIDIVVKNKEEYLVARTEDNKEFRLRLDKITLLEI